MIEKKYKYAEMFMLDELFYELSPEEGKKFQAILKQFVETLKKEEVSLFEFKNIISTFIVLWYEQNAVLPDDDKEKEIGKYLPY